MRTALILLLTLISVSAIGSAQPGSRGTDFWLSFMQPLRWAPAERPRDVPPPDLRVTIVAERAASCVVEMPRLGWSTTVAVAAGGEATVAIPAPLGYPWGSGTVEDLGVHVSASDTVTVLALNFIDASADAALVLPSDQLGDEYIVSAYDPFVVGTERYFPSVLVVASIEDGTTVQITPSAATLDGRPAGVPYSIRLDRGQIYEVEAWEDLTGTRVLAPEGSGCHSFALFAGSVLTQVGGCESADHLYEQMLPVHTWGREFVTVPLATRRFGDVFRIVARDDGTVVSIHGGSPVTLAAGAKLEVRLDTPGVVRASAPIAVAQFATGASCDNGIADPLMVLVPPMERAVRRAEWSSFSGLTFTAHFVNIVVQTSGAAGVLIDGAAPAASFAPVPGDPTLSYAVVPLQEGPHTLTSTTPAAAWCYGFGNPLGYGYPCGLAFDPPAVVRFSLRDSATSYCAGREVEFEAIGDTTLMLEWTFGDGGTARGGLVRHRFDSAGTFDVRLRVRTGRPCTSESVVRKIRVYPTPANISVTARCQCDSVMLEATAGYAGYRWSTGDTTRTIRARTGGDYSVVAIGEGGCQGASPPTHVVVPEDLAGLQIEPVADSVAPGGILPITISVPSRLRAGLCAPRNVRVTLSVSATMLAPDYVKGAKIIDDTIRDGRRYFTITITDSTARLELMGALGVDTSSAVIVERVGSEACPPQQIADTLSIVGLAGLCRAGGLRLFLEGETGMLRAVRPNPVRRLSTVEFVVLEDGDVRLDLYDARGRIARAVAGGDFVRGPHAAVLDVNGLPDGEYFLVMTARSQRYARRVVVAR